MTKRITLRLDDQNQKLVVKLARKLSLETSTGWTSQEVVDRCFRMGLTASVGHYRLTAAGKARAT
jgi:hypothetical protein